MATWTYSPYDSGYSRPLPKDASIEDGQEDDVGALEEAANACADDDHHNYDGWEGDRRERDIYLYRNGVLHSHFSVSVEYEPVFQASFINLAAQGGV